MAKDHHQPSPPQISGDYAAVESAADVDDDDLLMEEFSARTRCCSFLPCFGSTRSVLVGSASSPSVWEKLRHTADSDEKWWARPVRFLEKVREYSEIAAGPRWKNFIRRFSRKGSSGAGRRFNYDATSYSLNFDDGQNGNLSDDYGYPDFSSRYASVPNSCKSSIDWGKNGIPNPGSGSS